MSGCRWSIFYGPSGYSTHQLLQSVLFSYLKYVLCNFFALRLIKFPKFCLSRIFHGVPLACHKCCLVLSAKIHKLLISLFFISFLKFFPEDHFNLLRFYGFLHEKLPFETLLIWDVAAGGVLLCSHNWF